MGAHELSAMLWHERELLELLVFKLEEEQLLLTAGKSRWLQHATREVEQVLERLRDAGLAPASLELEMPEAMLAQHPQVKEQLGELRALGIRLTIDNFGTGNTSFKDFKDFGVDTVKIDKVFVQHLPHRREDSAIASAIINLAHDLGITVVAGGVETAEQLAYLKARDCTSAQGFIFSPPVSAEKYEELLLDESWPHIGRFGPPPSVKLH